MRDKPEGTAHRTSRGHVVAALCSAGVIAVALSGNLLFATGAREPAVPGEPGGEAPTQVQPRPQEPPPAATTPAATDTDGAAAHTPTTPTPVPEAPAPAAPAEPPGSPSDTEPESAEAAPAATEAAPPLEHREPDPSASPERAKKAEDKQRALKECPTTPNSAAAERERDKTGPDGERARPDRPGTPERPAGSPGRGGTPASTARSATAKRNATPQRSATAKRNATPQRSATAKHNAAAKRRAASKRRARAKRSGTAASTAARHKRRVRSARSGAPERRSASGQRNNTPNRNNTTTRTNPTNRNNTTDHANSTDRIAKTDSKALLKRQGKRSRDDGDAASTCRETQRPKSRATTAPERAARPVRAPRDTAPKVPLRNAEGLPTVGNPTTSLALPGPVAVGVPNFFIDKFRIPPFLLPIYQAAGIQYGIRWEILAAINEIETDYGRNLSISSAGALGWMQFMPSTWKQYGTDANRDGRKDPFNPVDAIFAAARYLRAAGADEDLRRAIFAYNHADWYVASVLMRARLIGGLPSDLVGSLNGLTQGHFPVFAKARYADDLAEHAMRRRARAGRGVATPVESEATRRGIDIFAKAGSRAIAVQDGTIVAMGKTKRLGNYVRLRDVYGNTYTYSRLKKVARHVPVPKHGSQSEASIAAELGLPQRDPKPTQPASAGRPTTRGATTGAAARPADPLAAAATAPAATTTRPIAKERLFANPGRRNAFTNGGARQILEAESALAAGASLRSYFTGVYGLDASDVVLKRLTAGRRVIAGTILGRIGKTSPKISPRLHFEIRPAGRGAPRIDPKPILDGWKLLESTAIYRARGANVLAGADAARASIGQIMLMSKESLARRVLANPRIEVYSCGRRDIVAGIVDRRVLATLEFLAASGMKPSVTSLQCGHSFYTAGGNVSAHSSGNAVDIAKINGVPIAGNQGEGSITDVTIRRLLTLQGTVKPAQIISLMTYEGADNTLALGDHADHIHVGFTPQYRPGTRASRQLESVLKPSQWIKLIDRLGKIENPAVAAKPSKYAIRVRVARASPSHRGE